MVSSLGFSLAALLGATLLLTGCQDLLPSRPPPPPPPPPVAVVTDTAPAKPQPPKPRPDPAAPKAAAGTDAAFRDISHTLRRLVATEQGFFAENGTYSGDLERLGFRPRGASRIEFIWVGKEGWAARATHPALPGRDCVTFTGAGGAVPATKRFGRTGAQGVVVCDNALPAAAARAASPPPRDSAPFVPDTASALDAVNPTVQMRADLRKLANAQTAYFGTQGTYSRLVETLPLQYGWQRGVAVTLIYADQRSWTARATHAADPGKSCVVWVGRPIKRPVTEAQRKAPERSGIPVCDD
ncbi:MAG TPA: hypothetical protein VH764_10485 [Gemmatimonadales bacterium]